MNYQQLFDFECVLRKADNTFCRARFPGDQQQDYERHVRTEHPEQADSLLTQGEDWAEGLAS